MEETVQPEKPKATLAFIGTTYTVNPDYLWAEAVAFQGSKIIYVGNKQDIQHFIHQDTEIIHIGDGLLLPGFIDAHIHAQAGALGSVQCNILSAASLDEALSMISAYHLANPDEIWINGMGWRGEWFKNGIAEASVLDKVVPDIPVTLRRYDGHAVWANTKAIEKAVTPEILEKYSHHIHQSPLGHPLGTFEENSENIFNPYRGVISIKSRTDAVNHATKLLTTCGITGYQEALVRGSSLDGYLLSEKVMKVNLALWWDPTKGLEQLEYFKEIRKLSCEKMQIRTIKLMLDGVVETQTAYMHEPYCKCSINEEDYDSKKSNIGFNHFNSDEAVKEIVALIDKEEFQVHFHAIGDKAVTLALDSIQHAIQKNGHVKNRRHHIAHLQVVAPQDILRMKSLDVVANFQPVWCVADHDMVKVITPLLGETRSLWQYPIKTFLQNGIKVCFGTDWYVSDYNPMVSIQAAITHHLKPEHPVWHPEECISLDEAIFAYTMGSAYVNFAETTCGSIEVGKAADVVLLEKNLFKIDPKEVKNVKVLMTLIDGKKVWDHKTNVVA